MAGSARLVDDSCTSALMISQEGIDATAEPTDLSLRQLPDQRLAMTVRLSPLMIKALDRPGECQRSETCDVSRTYIECTSDATRTESRTQLDRRRWLCGATSNQGTL